jgi:glucokinase
MNGPHAVIAVDVGGSKIAAGLVDVATGAVSDRRHTPTVASRGGDVVLAEVVRLVTELSRVAGKDVTGADPAIGIAVAELVDLRGRIQSEQTIAWSGVDLVEAVSIAGGPVVVSSDVRAGALAEARMGAGVSIDPFVYVSVGSGISSTLVIEGQPYAGARGNAIVAASGAFTHDCPACAEAVRVVPEDVASGHGMVERFAQMSPGTIVEGVADIAAAAATGDVEASTVLRQGGHMLGVIVARLVDLLDPEAVVIGGGLGLGLGFENAAEPRDFHEAFISSVRSHIWAENSRRVPIVPAALGVDAVLIGAAVEAAEGPDGAATSESEAGA